MLVHVHLVHVLQAAGNGVAGEVHGVVQIVRDHLHRAVGGNQVRVRDLLLQAAEVNLRVVEQADDLAHHLRLHQRLITLNVDEQVTLHLGGHLGHPVRTGGVVGAGHYHGNAVALAGGLNSLVVGGHIHRVQLLHLFGLAVHPPDHGAAADVRQGLAGEAGRTIACRNDTNDFHNRELLLFDTL